MSQVLAGAEAIKPAAQTLSEKDRCVVIGRGFHHSTAYEWALKIAELSYLVAQPFSAADFRHGPLGDGRAGFAGPGRGDRRSAVRRRLRSSRPGRESGRPRSSRSPIDRDCPADHLIELPQGLPEWLTPIPAIVAAQIFTYYLTLARGADPDQPRMLKKVTRTV